MTWEDFYDRFYGWSDSTAINRISQLTSFGSHEEVAEIVQAYADEKAATRLAKKAMAAGVCFTPEDLVDMQMCVTKECMDQMVRTVDGDFTQEQVEELCYSMSDEVYAELEKKYCHYDDEEDEPEETEEPIPAQQRQRRPGLLGGLFALMGAGGDFDRPQEIPRFHIGDHVRVRYRGQEGTIIDINGGLYMVSLPGGRVDSFPESALERAW